MKFDTNLAINYPKHMLKKLLIFFVLSIISVSYVYALSIEPIGDIPPKKSSETIEEYKARMKEYKQQYIDEYKQQLREQKSDGLDQYQEQLREQKQTQTQTQETTKEEVKDKVCLNLENLLDQKVSRFGDVQSVHLEKYSKLSTRLDDVTTSLKGKGYDTTQLESDLKELDGLISDYSQAYSDFVDSLIFTRGNACNTDSDFRDALRNSKELLVVVKQKRADIREFYTGIIREDIRDLRQQADDLASKEGN